VRETAGAARRPAEQQHPAGGRVSSIFARRPYPSAPSAAKPVQHGGEKGKKIQKAYARTRQRRRE